MDKPLNGVRCEKRFGWQVNGVSAYPRRCLAAARLVRMVHSMVHSMATFAPRQGPNTHREPVTSRIHAGGKPPAAGRYDPFSNIVSVS